MTFPRFFCFLTLLSIVKCQESASSVYDLIDELRYSTTSDARIVNGSKPNLSAIRISSVAHLKNEKRYSQNSLSISILFDEGT
ncbi:hypothetical protein GDO81_001512 [Engystomops pustulosus]|uniref:Uncharacterized protein n=1 Tax=Engystomops pustulosus TaxID=76066 RepID=A0AAV7DE16_ENGPU|nr:hypothetical protein GDO81_001512 [Engystomops pustulosus]